MVATSNRLTKAEQAKLISALEKQDARTVQRFLKDGWNPARPIKGIVGENALNYCDSELLAKLLIANGANVNLGTDNWTPILLNCDTGNHKLVKLLIASGADVNVSFSRKRDCQVPFGTTPLMKAANHGYVRIVKDLLTAGADINALDEHSHNALFHALRSNETPTAKELMKRGSMLADDALGGPIHYGNLELVKLLIAKNANVNCTLHAFDKRALFTEGETLLGCAVRKTGLFDYPLKIVELLLKAGARVNQPSRYLGKSIPPISIAASRGREDVVKILQKAGANTTLKEALSGVTLHGACFAGQAGVVKLLIKSGADVNARDPKGKRPIEYVRAKRCDEITQLLKQAGAHD